MPRLKYGQVAFDKMPPPLRTCHDIRLWRGCPQCGNTGSKNNMVQTADTFWHGRCFVKKFSLERLLDMPRKEIVKLTLGDMGVALMSEVITELDKRKGPTP